MDPHGAVGRNLPGRLNSSGRFRVVSSVDEPSCPAVDSAPLCEWARHQMAEWVTAATTKHNCVPWCRISPVVDIRLVSVFGCGHLVLCSARLLFPMWFWAP